MKRILLAIDRPQRIWVAHFLEDEEPDGEILGLFGTHILPTPFAMGADPIRVLELVKSRNPDRSVDMQILTLESRAVTSLKELGILKGDEL